MRFSSLAIGVVFLSGLGSGLGCATATSIVKKPEINQVHRVAIVSITAPQRVPHRNGKFHVTGWGTENRQAIADQAFGSYVAEFKKLGWEVIPAAQLSALPLYRENFAPKFSDSNTGVMKTLNALSTKDAEGQFFSPTGLYPIVWDEEKGKNGEMRLDLGTFTFEKTKTLKTKMQEMALKAGADAAVLVQMDYCYDDGSFWYKRKGSGTGTAVITGASAIYAVTPKGVEVVKMAKIPGGCLPEHRVSSDGSTPMVAGHLIYNNGQIQKMFLEIAQKTAAENVRQIQEAMKK